MLYKTLSDDKELLLPPDPWKSGGEGNVYPVDSELVAKIYHEPTRERSDKLKVMLLEPPQGEASTNIAWPIDLIYSGHDRSLIVGYTMTKVRQSYPIIKFYNPVYRRNQFPSFTYKSLLRLCTNTASLFSLIHRKNYVIGDVRENNILGSEHAVATIVDTDSFQVIEKTTGAIFRCPVGTPEYTPAEWRKDTPLETQHDLFGLGVLIFKMLMSGRHPFFGIYTKDGDPPSYSERIQKGHFPYSKLRKTPYEPPPLTLPFSSLTPRLQELFLTCFDLGHDNPKVRPDAIEWHEALDKAERSLKKCTHNPQHLYSDHLGSCLWCEQKDLFEGRDPFPSKTEVESGNHLKTPSASHSFKRKATQRQQELERKKQEQARLARLERERKLKEQRELARLERERKRREKQEQIRKAEEKRRAQQRRAKIIRTSAILAVVSLSIVVPVVIISQTHTSTPQEIIPEDPPLVSLDPFSNDANALVVTDLANLKAEPSVLAQTVQTISQNELLILEGRRIVNERAGLINQRTFINGNTGRTQLSEGDIVMLASMPINDSYSVIYWHNGREMTGTVSVSDLHTSMEQVWRKATTRNGEEGWILSDQVRANR